VLEGRSPRDLVVGKTQEKARDILISPRDSPREIMPRSGSLFQSQPHDRHGGDSPLPQLDGEAVALGGDQHSPKSG
jgi:hypothetical protein